MSTAQPLDSVARRARLGFRHVLQGHPRGLAVLFFSEMWERFSFYGMRALLILYMTDQLLLPGSVEGVWGFAGLRSVLESVFGPLSIQAMSSQIYGLYTGLLYVTPVFGGLLADRMLGQRRTVVLGALLMAAGHFLMAFGATFLLALLLIIAGNGCFKPNVSAQVGALYAPDDVKRDSAYSMFYVGINLGAFIAPVICGTLGEAYGWHYGFLAAGVGMLVGLSVFTLGARHLPPDVRARDAASTDSGRSRRLSANDRRAVVALCLVALVTTFFWAAYEQQGNALVLWAKNFTDRSFFGLFEIKITWFQTLNPFLIFALTPMLLAHWARRAALGKEPGTITKMGIGCFLAAAAYIVLTVAALAAGEGGTAGWAWIVGYFVLLTLGELFVSPIALSLFYRVAPAQVLSMMIGVWFLSGVVGNYLTGLIGSFWEFLPKAYFWLLMSAIGVGAGLIMFAFKRPLERILAERAVASPEPT